MVAIFKAVWISRRTSILPIALLLLELSSSMNMVALVFGSIPILPELQSGKIFMLVGASTPSVFATCCMFLLPIRGLKKNLAVNSFVFSLLGKIGALLGPSVLLMTSVKVTLNALALKTSVLFGYMDFASLRCV